MPDPVPQIQAKFSNDHRYANYGPVLAKITIDGFRGINELEVSFESPVTAFSGLNGAGKSTVGQLVVCAYKKPSTAQQYKRYYVKDFFPASVADPNPFSQDARAIYSYQTDVPESKQEVTVSRANAEWSGYKRQPERQCYYVGFSLYIPKIERKDFSIYRSTKLELRDIRNIPEEVRAKVSSILNEPYEEVHFQGIATKNKNGELAMARRYGALYSENNMGFGEGRILYMVDLLENEPEQSLFVLEEPETSLHKDAQHRLARYLLDVANRRHHQIILSTHSGTMLNALPPESRCLIHRNSQGVTIYPRISANRAKAILSGGHDRLQVIVEDDFAKAVLTEVVRANDPDMLQMIRIEGIGSHSAVKEALKLLDKLQTRAVGFVDGDANANPAQGVECLPGNEAPEREVFGNRQIQELLDEKFGINSAHLTVDKAELDHHEYAKEIATAVMRPADSVICLCAEHYAQNCVEHAQRQAIVDFIRQHLED